MVNKKYGECVIYSVIYNISKTFKDQRKTNQVDIIDQFLVKLAALRILSKGVKNFPHTAY